jgi:beta-lactam-binding protein with PASTA domain
VIGLKLAKARRRIIKRHCRVGKITRKFSTQAMQGRVLKQHPKGSRRKRKNGFKVALTVGKRPRT